MSALRMGRLLVCLSAVLAPGALAVRMGHAGAPPVLAATGVMNKISLLLKDRSHQSKSGARRTMHAIHLSTQRVENRETPTVRTTLASTLTNVVTQIQDNVDAQILQDRAQAQTDINAKVDQVGHDSDLAEKRLGALVSDTTWFDCVGSEVDKLRKWQTEQTNEADAKNKKDEAYDALLKATSFESEIPRDLLSLKCTPDTCYAALDALHSKREDYSTALSTAISESYGVYQNAVQDHNTKLARHTDLRDTIVPNAENDFRQKRAECLVEAVQRQNDICNHLGVNIRNMCEHIDEYDDLNRDVRSREADRQDSWEASSIVKCLLREVIDVDTFEISNETLAACSDPANQDLKIPGAALDFKEQVVRDFQIAPLKAQDVSSTSEFKCVDTLVEFTSKWWTAPGGTGYPGAQNDPSTYVEQTSWEATVQLGPGEMPFDFCDDLKPCSEHACIQGSADSSKVCVGTEDCEAACCSKQEPAAQKPASQQPVAQQPVAQRPAAQQPSASAGGPRGGAPPWARGGPPQGRR